MNEPFVPPQPTAEQVPAAEISLPVGAGEYRHASYPVRRPAEEFDEFMVECRASVLRQVRIKLGKIKKTDVTLSEFLLALAAMAAGTWLGALSSAVSYTSDPWLWRLYFGVLPVAAIGFGLAYWFTRQKTLLNAADLADAILAELPDPNNTK